MSENTDLTLVPWPRRVNRKPGAFQTAGATWCVSAEITGYTAIAHKLQALAGDTRVSPELSGATLTIGTPRLPHPKAPMREQGYRLVVDEAGVALNGADLDGLFWGLVTLEQLLDTASALPCLRIDDWPEMLLRGHHDDVSRKQISTVADFKEIVRLLSRYKVNVYTPYLEDVLHLEHFPDIGEGRGKLMPDEVAAIVREGERHNVQIMPTFSLAGHQENLLLLPRYIHLGRKVFQPASSLDPANPAVRRFLEKVIENVCEQFPCAYFHMCFDEMIGMTETLFLDHANWCATELFRRGKTPVMWADMIYNHYGREAISKLHPAIIPVVWGYGPRAAERMKRLKWFTDAGREAWGLAGYSNWGAFMPDFEAPKEHFADWMRYMKRVRGKALFCSMWGDDGYENSRQMCWNLYAAFGERTWSGPQTRRDNFEARFQQTFYGCALPRLERVVRELVPSMSLQPGELWRLHRRRPSALVRLAATNPGRSKAIGADVKLVQHALRDVAAARAQAVHRAEHLDHFTVALERTLSVLHRLHFAHRVVRGLSSDERRAAVKGLRAELRATRRNYARVWLRHNKPENIDVSLNVFDRIDEAFGKFAVSRRIPGGLRKRFHMLDLPWNTNVLDIAGVPIGETLVNDIPFRFAPRTHTHVVLQGKGNALTLDLPRARIADLHLVGALQRPGDDPEAALRVEWLRDSAVVFSEDLLSITHLCDWWAILGEHMWAGGGFRYIDPIRVRLALLPDDNYGLTHLSGFGNCGTPEIDAIRLTMLVEEEYRLFAATVEPRRI